MPHAEILKGGDGPPAGPGPCRHRILNVSAQMFAEFLKGGIGSYEVAGHALPDDARIVDVVWDHAHEIINLKVESDSFPGVPEGGRIPELDSPGLRWAGAVKAVEAEASRN